MKEELRNIAVDVYPLSVELSIDDFEYLIEAALAHEDQFFENLWVSLAKVKVRQDEQSAKG